MKTKIFILSGFVLLAFAFSSLTCLQQEAKQKHESLGFFETYAWNEVLAGVDPADKLFHWLKTEGMDKNDCRLGTCQKAHAPELWAHIHSDAFQKQLAQNVTFAWEFDQGKPEKVLYALKPMDTNSKRPDASHIEEISVKQSDFNDSYELLMSFSGEGARLWAELTRANVNKSIAIVFNEEVYSAPNVREAIKNGKCSISGSFTKADVDLIKSILEQ